jgi:hypothetical protein
MIVLLLSACTLVTVKVPGEPLSRKELNIRVATRDFARHFANSVEETADRIISESPDPAMQSRALRWKLNAVAEVQNTVFQAVPMLALVDTWTFNEQMADFFMDGQGRALFGPWQVSVIDSARALNERIEKLGRSVISEPQFESYKKFVQRTARQMPISSLSFYRESVLSLWAQFEGKNEEELVSTVGTAPEVLEDFINRFAFYEQTVPKRVQWATQLYMLESGAGERIDAQLAALNTTSDALVASTRRAAASFSRVERRLIRLADESPELIDSALARFNTDLAPQMEQLNTSWASTIDLLHQVNQRWETSLQTLGNERQALLEAYQNERALLLQQTDLLLEKTWKHAKSAITRLSLYAIVVILLLLALPFAMGVLVGRATRRTDGGMPSRPDGESI